MTRARAADGRAPPTAREITTGRADRAWLVDVPTPYVLKYYGASARAVNEAAVLHLLATHSIPAPRLLEADTASISARNLCAVIDDIRASLAGAPHLPQRGPTHRRVTATIRLARRRSTLTSGLGMALR
ncbi:phosphotransferase [Streptomyces sp. CNQ085]|uniref:phosphotransferase n=1 Tax=Streptomyces sp. CNQ085 TaxID=2886944 RepID=UPI001F50C724|nr:phosphotransferase [Streptomyces sp. CNQ085]MCI0385088.1 phosphotransferase [Streptomyces sp. CNQ085]